MGDLQSQDIDDLMAGSEDGQEDIQMQGSRLRGPGLRIPTTEFQPHCTECTLGLESKLSKGLIVEDGIFDVEKRHR